MSAERIALVACSAQKLEHAAPARELYTGALFKAARAYAEATCDGWAILSAQHGLVSPDTVLDPYDLALASLPREGRDAWGERVAAQLRVLYGFGAQAGVTFVVLAGATYATPLMRSLDPATWDLELPLRGLAIGQQKAWLKRETTKALPGDGLDVRLGRLRLRCFVAVQADPENCLIDSDGVMHPGDLLLEEGEGDDWCGGVIIREADRAELARLVAPALAAVGATS